MGKQVAMVMDLNKCIGCQACSVACRSENEVPLKVFRLQVQMGFIPQISVFLKLCRAKKLSELYWVKLAKPYRHVLPLLQVKQRITAFY